MSTMRLGSSLHLVNGLGWLIGLSVIGCGTATPNDIPTQCARDADCVVAGVAGKCTLAGPGEAWCASQDVRCPSGYRWDSTARANLAGSCVREGDMAISFPDEDGGLHDDLSMSPPPDDMPMGEDLTMVTEEDLRAPVDLRPAPDLTMGPRVLFGAEVLYGVGPAPNHIAIGDVNGDKKIDVVAASSTGGGGSSISVLLGNGDGTLGKAVAYAAGSDSEAITLADVDGDKRLDALVIAPLDMLLLVMRNLGNGTFGKPQNVPLGVRPNAVAAGDLDGDGDIDVVVAGGPTGAGGPPGNADVVLGNGDGTFGNHKLYPAGPAAGCCHDVKLADVNGDGNLDILLAEAISQPGGFSGPGSLKVLLGNGDGTFGACKLYLGDTQPRAVGIADWNKDGNLDVAMPDSQTGNASVFIGVGDGTFQAKMLVRLANPPAEPLWVLRGEDFDRDGAPDFVVGSSTLGLLVRRGNGDGSFQPVESFPSQEYSLDIQVADLNGDKKPDLVVAHPSKNQVGVLLNGW